MTTIIGLAGRARTGKDTAAAYLEDMFGFEPVAFAAPIKTAIADWFDLDARHLEGDLKETPLPDIGKSHRQLFQTLGTEWCRQLVHPDVWIYVMDAWLRRLEREYFAQGAQLFGVVVSDVRFDNEAEWVRRRGGLLIHLERGSAPDVSAHISESGVTRADSDIVLRNDGTIDELYEKLNDIVMAQLGVT